MTGSRCQHHRTWSGESTRRRQVHALDQASTGAGPDSRALANAVGGPYRTRTVHGSCVRVAAQQPELARPDHGPASSSHPAASSQGRWHSADRFPGARRQWTGSRPPLRAAQRRKLGDNELDVRHAIGARAIRGRLDPVQTPPRRTRTEPPRRFPRGRSTSSRWRRRGVLDERFMCRSSARMPAAIVHGIGTPTVARLHGRRYAPDTEPAPPRSGKHEVPQKGRASRLGTSRRRLASRVR